MPPPPKGPDEGTLRFLRGAFQRHYRSGAVKPPDRLRKREFAFMPFTGGLMQRHVGFTGPGELHTSLASRVPAHVYYSSAYYERPGAPTMDEKGWQGADLVFDLDADHLPGAKGMTYPQMLAEVKRLFTRLVDDFLTEDFGFRESSILVVFSGGRGYHAHVRDPEVLTLGSHERRELVDHITMKDIDPAVVMREVDPELIAREEKPDPLVRDIVYEREKKFPRRVKKTIRLYPETTPGRRGRLTRYLADWLDSLGDVPKGQAVKTLMETLGVDERQATGIHTRLFEERDFPRAMAIAKVRQGLIDFFPPESRVVDATKRALATVGGIKLIKGETDEPVTSDIKRLIRLPTSLHGKSGLQVTAMSRAALDDFDPLRDALPEAFGDDPMKIELRAPAEIKLRSESFNLTQGVTEVPEFAAVFLACRGVARVS